MEKTGKFPRLEMLGKTLTKSQNDLVLYDLLREKNLTQFYVLLKQGYSLDAFVLNCLIDNGFEDHILKALSLCGRYDDDVYGFLKLYQGEQDAKACLVAYNFERLIENEFSDQELIDFGLWHLLLKRKEYWALWVYNQRDLLFQYYRETKDAGVRDYLAKNNCVEIFISEGDFDALKLSAAGRVKLFEMKDWGRVLSLGKAEREELAQTVLVENSGCNELYAYIAKRGGVEELYKSEVARDWMLSAGLTEPFVANGNWISLYNEGFYHLVDVEAWADGYGYQNFVFRCAVKQKKWDFLERRGGLAALFFHFHWNRWRRCVVSSFFEYPYGRMDRIVHKAIKQKDWDFLEDGKFLKALFFHFRWCRWGRCVVSRFFGSKE